MFNSANGAAAISQAIEVLTDEFAANFDSFLKDPSIDSSVKKALIAQFAAIMANRTAAQSLAAGTYAQASNGSPALALGAGNATGNTVTLTDPEFQAIGAIRTANPGQLQAFKRLMNPSDPEFMLVDANGTPLEVGQLRREVGQLRQELDDERDPNQPRSLAQQNHDLNQRLAAATTGMVPQADLDAANTTAQVNLDTATTAQADLATAKTALTAANTALADLKTKVRAQVTNLNLDTVESVGFGNKKVSIEVQPATVRAAARSLDTLTS